MIGNTTDSAPVIPGSSPGIPTKARLQIYIWSLAFFCSLEGQMSFFREHFSRLLDCSICTHPAPLFWCDSRRYGRSDSHRHPRCDSHRGWRKMTVLFVRFCRRRNNQGLLLGRMAKRQMANFALSVSTTYCTSASVIVGLRGRLSSSRANCSVTGSESGLYSL